MANYNDYLKYLQHIDNTTKQEITAEKDSLNKEIAQLKISLINLGNEKAELQNEKAELQKVAGLEKDKSKKYGKIIFILSAVSLIIISLSIYICVHYYDEYNYYYNEYHDILQNSKNLETKLKTLQSEIDKYVAQEISLQKIKSTIVSPSTDNIITEFLRFQRDAQNSFRYKGDWKNGKPNGKGVAVYGDCRIYEGYFVDGYRQGQGKMTYPNGKLENGQWEKDKFFKSADWAEEAPAAE